MSVAELRVFKFKWKGNLKDSQKKKTVRRIKIYVGKK